MSIEKLHNIDCSGHIEKKNGLSYLSWAWAWTEVLKIDPKATWEAMEFNGLPCVFLPDGSAMVKVIVNINDHTKSCWLPVMDHRNKAIKNPDAFAINTAIVRCMVKAIAMHGLGLFIYAGEDLPEDGPPANNEAYEAKHLQKMRDASLNGKTALKAAFDTLPEDGRVAFWTKYQKELKLAADKAESIVEQLAGQA